MRLTFTIRYRNSTMSNILFRHLSPAGHERAEAISMISISLSAGQALRKRKCRLEENDSYSAMLKAVIIIRQRRSSYSTVVSGANNAHPHHSSTRQSRISRPSCGDDGCLMHILYHHIDDFISISSMLTIFHSRILISPIRESARHRHRREYCKRLDAAIL